MTGAPGDVLDDLFHGCALDAYLEVWQETGAFPPDSERVRRLAYRLYEDELARKNSDPVRAGRTPSSRNAG
jgi:hypothetical protein